MGADVQISIKSKELNEDEIKKLNQEIYHRFHIGKDQEWWEFKWSEDDEAYTLHSLMRYYGDGYERGPWPQIHALLRYVKDFVGGKGNVFYYSDSNCLEDINSPTTYLDIEQIFTHWLDVGHKPYLGLEENHPCPECKNYMWRSGYSGKGDIYSCTMCSYSDWPNTKDSGNVN